jgi:hypothetical protein
MAFWKLPEQASSDDTWKQIDQTPIPVGAGRIWLADKDGNVRRAMAWTWRIIKRREPGKYLHWMKRAARARQPSSEAMKQLPSGK